MSTHTTATYTATRTLLHVHCCTYTATRTLLHVHCCTYTATRTLLHVHSYTYTATRTLLHVHCYTYTGTRTLLHVHCYTYTVTRALLRIPAKHSSLLGTVARASRRRGQELCVQYTLKQIFIFNLKCKLSFYFMVIIATQYS